MKIKTDKIQVSQKLNENVFIEVPDCGDYVPEIKIEFINCDIQFTSVEKLEIGHLIKDYIIKKAS